MMHYAHVFVNYSVYAHQWAIFIQIVSWSFQIFGHVQFEKRAPAFLDNAFQAVALAPLFVFCEFLFLLGIRKQLNKELDTKIVSAIREWKQSSKKK